MTHADHHTPEIGEDELDWEKAKAYEGRQPGSVVSVRLDPAETARVRALADSLGLNVSQLVRRALEAYEPEASAPRTAQFVAAFTYGGTVPSLYEQVWQYVGAEQLELTHGPQRRSGDAVPTGTEPTRIVERVTV